MIKTKPKEPQITEETSTAKKDTTEQPLTEEQYQEQYEKEHIIFDEDDEVIEVNFE